MSGPLEFILTLSCRDTKGIVHAVSGTLFEAGCNILDSQQYGDVRDADSTGLFFMRVHFEAPAPLGEGDAARAMLAPLRERFAMQLDVHALGRKPRLLVLVSRQGHCLNDLLFRCASNQLPAEIAGVVSNHPDFAELCAGHGVPFHHLPLATGVGDSAKRAQESRIEQLMVDARIDLVVLARYMQILSPAFCAALKGGLRICM
jgi:formyltetrahydrofolate deformylase